MINYSSIQSLTKAHPDKIALKDDSKILTWVEFQNAVSRLITKMNALNIDLNSSCLLISRNNIDLVLLGSALSTLSIPFQCVDYHLDIKVIAGLIKNISTSHIFVSREFFDKFTNLKDFCSVAIIEDFIENTIDEYELILNHLNYRRHSKYQSFSFTSGTTGNPKIVYRTSSFDSRRFEYLKNRYNFNEKDVHLCCLPMYHVSSTGWLRLFLSLGCTVVIHNYSTSYQLCETLYSNKISTTIMSPIFLKQIIHEIDNDDTRKLFSNLRFLITGGKKCSAHLKKLAINRLGNIIHEYYGTTETGINTLLDSDDAEQFFGSVGREFEGNKILILNKDNVPMQFGVVGKIAISSYMNMDQYLNYPTDSIIIDNERYLLTSDFGYKNDQGYLYVFQRSNSDFNEIYDFISFENEILSLEYIKDVNINKSNGISVDIVPKSYRPASLLLSAINEIGEKYGMRKLSINIVSDLVYTPTGKIKLTSVISA